MLLSGTSKIPRIVLMVALIKSFYDKDLVLGMGLGKPDSKTISLWYYPGLYT